MNNNPLSENARALGGAGFGAASLGFGAYMVATVPKPSTAQFQFTSFFLALGAALVAWFILGKLGVDGKLKPPFPPLTIQAVGGYALFIIVIGVFLSPVNTFWKPA